ncbi:MAG: GNAT family N-acetyltransferase [Proteobacteria bacterium]|nr:GNAT family N-acetyltransferase [Pseudomonadota bacterium]
MKSNIQIRKARPEDNEEVTAFAFEIMRALGIEPDPENIDHALAKFGQEKEIPFHEFVAFDEEQIVGSIILRPRPSSVAEMTGFYVRSSFRGQGVGHMLIRTLLFTAIEGGYEEVVLTTNRNMTAAISLYESYGWIRQSKKPDNGADYLYSLRLR